MAVALITAAHGAFAFFLFYPVLPWFISTTALPLRFVFAFPLFLPQSLSLLLHFVPASPLPLYFSALSDRPVFTEILSVFEAADHLIGQGNVVVSGVDLVAGEPDSLCDLIGILDCDFIAPLDITDHTDQQVRCEAPGLGFVIADVGRLEAGFLHHLTADGILNSLSDLTESGDQGSAGISILFAAPVSDFLTFDGRHTVPVFYSQNDFTIASPGAVLLILFFSRPFLSHRESPGGVTWDVSA